MVFVPYLITVCVEQQIPRAVSNRSARFKSVYGRIGYCKRCSRIEAYIAVLSELPAGLIFFSWIEYAIGNGYKNTVFRSGSSIAHRKFYPICSHGSVSNTYATCACQGG